MHIQTNYSLQRTLCSTVLQKELTVAQQLKKFIKLCTSKAKIVLVKPAYCVMVHTFCDCASFCTFKLFIRISQVVISVRFQFRYWVLYLRATFNLLYFGPAIGVNACVSALLATRLSKFLCPMRFVVV
jgi:hypothetical protein